MNEVSFDAPRPEAVRDLSGTIAAQAQHADPAVTEELAKNFLTRVQRDIDEQVDLRVHQQLASGNQRRKPITSEELGLALGSLGIGIPLSGIAGVFGHLPGLITVWVALAIINLSWARRR